MADLKLFAGVHQALGHMCLRDGRARREIAEAAGINPSMLSGYCSGRLVPSLEHLDRLLVALHREPEDFIRELRFVTHTERALRSAKPPHATPEENEVAEATLKRILNEIRFLIISEMNGLETVKPLPKREQIAQARAAAERLQAEAMSRSSHADHLEALLRDEEAASGRQGPERKER